MTKLVDLYMNFGVIGIMGGMFLLGILVKSCYTYLVKNRRSIYTIFSYTFLVALLIDIDHDFGSTLVEFIRLIFIFWIIRQFVYPIRKHIGSNTKL